MRISKIFKIMSISTLLLTAVFANKAYANITGEWKQDTKGWWYKYSNGTYPANTWLQINGAWYHFGADGYMSASKWIDSNGWYYVGANGAMLVNTTTPDGYYVNETGLWTDKDSQVLNNTESSILNTTTNQSTKSNTVNYVSVNEYNDNAANYSTIPIEVKAELANRYRAGQGTGEQEVNGKWYYVLDDGYIIFNQRKNGYFYGIDGAWDGSSAKTKEQVLAEFYEENNQKRNGGITTASSNLESFDANSKENSKEVYEHDAKAIKEELMRLINEHRVSLGLDEFDISNSDIQYGADLRAEEIGVRFSHIRPNGKWFYTAIKNFKGGGGECLTSLSSIDNSYSNEDIAKIAFNNWINSSAHRKTIEKDENRSLYANVGVNIKEKDINFVFIVGIQKIN